MRKKLTKHGNSLALVIDKPLLDLLHADADTIFEISTDGKAMVISPIQKKAHKKKIKEALEKADMKYGRMLKHLAQ